MGDGVHQVQEGGVLVEDVIERSSFQAEILEEEMEQSDDSREEVQTKGFKYSSKRGSAFICCHGLTCREQSGTPCPQQRSTRPLPSGAQLWQPSFFRSQSFVKHAAVAMTTCNPSALKGVVDEKVSFL